MLRNILSQWNEIPNGGYFKKQKQVASYLLNMYGILKANIKEL